MSKLGPAFINVTWGAGGSTAQKSLSLAATCQKDLGLTTCLHLTCTNMDQTILDAALKQAKQLGIRNILALRGDPPRGQEYGWTGASGEFQYAVDLVKYIRKHHGDWFCIGVAAYPEGHTETSAEGPVQDPAKDMPFLLEKVKAGADFIITQFFYDAEAFIRFENMMREYDPCLADIILVPGLMPINTYQQFMRASKLCNAAIPDNVRQQLNSIANDDEKVKSLGVRILCDLISTIRIKTKNRVRGFHFYTLNLEKSVALTLEHSGLLQPAQSTEEEAIASSDEEDGVVADNLSRAARRKSSVVSNRAIVEHSNRRYSEAEISPEEAGHESRENPRKRALAISSGEGDLGREATWDDFPNGRFGNSRSPAYGQIDGYGPSLHVEPSRALKIWGYPVEPKDITKLFVRHITNELDALPWSEEPLSGETALIQEQLLQLNEASLWTVASQPAGNSIKSEDKIFGWGPRGGKIFQKAFVEFFVSDEDWKKIKSKVEENEWVTYYEGNSSSEHGFSTNLEPGSSNAVTWAVFPNREIVQSTIIEEESFIAWRDEAFSVWKEWQKLYHPGSATAKLLQHIYDTYHLVSITHHDYFHDQALWDMLLDIVS